MEPCWRSKSRNLSVGLEWFSLIFHHTGAELDLLKWSIICNQWKNQTEASAQVSKSGFSTHIHRHTQTHSRLLRATAWRSVQQSWAVIGWENRNEQDVPALFPLCVCVCVFCIACSPQRCMCSQCVHCDPASQPDLSRVWRPTALYKICLQLLSIKMCLLCKKHDLQLCCHCPCLLLSFLFVLQQFLMVTR